MRAATVIVMCGFAMSIGCTGSHDEETARDTGFRWKETFAYVDGLGITVYLVQEEEVVEIRLPLHKNGRVAPHTVHIEKGGATARLLRGKDVWKEVRPAGVRPPLDPAIRDEQATAGSIVCGDMPVAMAFPYDTTISIVEADLVFPARRIRITEGLRPVLRAWPP